MPKRRRKPVPHTILWSIQDQRRFVDAVEQLHSVVHQLVHLVTVAKDVMQALEARSNAGKKAAETRRRRKNESGRSAPLGDAGPVFGDADHGFPQASNGLPNDPGAGHSPGPAAL